MQLSFNGNYPVTRDFGVYDPAYANYPGSRHPGTDWGLPANTQLIASMSGTVKIYDRDPNVKTGRGKEVVITDGNRQRKTCHMNRIHVKDGQKVSIGDPIGLSGYTGYVVDWQGKVGTPEGAHLHDEYLENGVYKRIQDNLGGEVVMLTEDQFYQTFRGMMGRDPSQEEAKTMTRKAGLLVETLWNNGSKARFENRVNDGDVINLKRSETQVPDYQPPGPEFDHYKNPVDGWKKLAYDTAAGMQVQIDLAKQQGSNGIYEEVPGPLYKKKG